MDVSRTLFLQGQSQELGNTPTFNTAVHFYVDSVKQIVLIKFQFVVK